MTEDWQKIDWDHCCHDECTERTECIWSLVEAFPERIINPQPFCRQHAEEIDDLFVNVLGIRTQTKIWEISEFKKILIREHLRA